MKSSSSDFSTTTSEQSADTVIYVNPCRDNSDGEHPPRGFKSPSRHVTSQQIFTQNKLIREQQNIAARFSSKPPIPQRPNIRYPTQNSSKLPR